MRSKPSGQDDQEVEMKPIAAGHGILAVYTTDIKYPPPRLPRPEAGTAGGMVVANREPALEEPRSLKPKHHSDNSDRGINSAISFAAPGLHSERGVEGLSPKQMQRKRTGPKVP